MPGLIFEDVIIRLARPLRQRRVYLSNGVS